MKRFELVLYRIHDGSFRTCGSHYVQHPLPDIRYLLGWYYKVAYCEQAPFLLLCLDFLLQY
jgi:hypothetical protein